MAVKERTWYRARIPTVIPVFLGPSLTLVPSRTRLRGRRPGISLASETLDAISFRDPDSKSGIYQSLRPSAPLRRPIWNSGRRSLIFPITRISPSRQEDPSTWVVGISDLPRLRGRGVRFSLA